MASSSPSLYLLPFITLLLLLPHLSHSSTISKPQLTALLTLKTSLDPSNAILTSWSSDGDPCKDDTFEGVCCNENGQVANISLQGKGLTGELSPAIGELKQLTGLYLHYNSLVGEIPKEVAELKQLSDLYLNVNNISGEIPTQVGDMESLQVLQLCYNQLTGSIPTQLGSLKKLTVIALQANQLTGAIPASLGDLNGLVRVDLSFNKFFGSIPTRLANASQLETFDIRNNSLSGSVPPALKRLNEGFLYTNNKGLCGIGFTALSTCTDSELNSHHTLPEPTNSLPETANILSGCNPPQQCSSASPHNSHHSHASFAFSILGVIAAISVIGFIAFARHRRRKQKLATAMDYSDNRRLSIDIPNEFRKNGSPLISLEYPNGWDPLATHHHDNTTRLEEDIIQNFRFNSEEIESATQHFSPSNLLGRRNSGFSAVYRGMLRDGSVVAIKKISKSSCKSEEAEFLKGLNVLTSLRHENLVKLRGFCCSKGRGECFLVYEFVTNGNLLKYLDVVGDGERNVVVLDWETRVSIIKGVAKGIQYLHSYKVNKPPLVHQNISAEKVLLDERFNPLLSDSGFHKLLTNDTVFSTLKSSAAMGYLAPEYTTTGKFTEKSDVYAFGVLVLQILSGRRKITQSIRLAAEGSRVEEFLETNLLRGGKFSEQEAAGLAKLAISCTHESAFQRPSMEAIGLELSKYGGSNSGSGSGWLYTSP